MRHLTVILSAMAAALVIAVLPRAVYGFCGFYVSGADTKLYNNATMVVLMRDGTRTVLSMQNNYEGPPEDFAMVVPVPVVLWEENVKTLPNDVFDRVDQLASPRLVEYWEQDPCNPYTGYGDEEIVLESVAVTESMDDESEEPEDLGVRIEAQFTVGEYEIVILSAQDSTGLDTWLRRENYRIPEGAEPLLRPYVAAGMKFFVAKVDVAKVRFAGSQALLSPLRFYYDSEQFNLPVRLGLMNSRGIQDLIVHILAPNQRYEVANYDNVTIPTNLDVNESVRTQFGRFYAALFDATLERFPNAVVTEYAWDAASCDPCPGPVLSADDLATLGQDVIPGALGKPMVLTRLHARYASSSLGQDLVFRTAPAISGGQGTPGADGAVPHGAMASGINMFQGRYIIRYPWLGPIQCAQPVRGVWGGPPHAQIAAPAVQAAQDIGLVPRGPFELGAALRSPIREGDIRTSTADRGSSFRVTGLPTPRPGGCAGCTSASGSTGVGPGALAGLALGIAVAVWMRRRRP